MGFQRRLLDHLYDGELYPDETLPVADEPPRWDVSEVAEVAEVERLLAEHHAEVQANLRGDTDER